MYKAFYAEDRKWALGRIGGGRGGEVRDTRKERVGDGSFNRVGIFAMLPCARFFFLLFLYMDPFFP